MASAPVGSQVAQTLDLDDVLKSQHSQQSEVRPWGRLFPLTFLFGEAPHPLRSDLVTVGRAEDCTIVLEKSKESSKGTCFDKYYKAYSKLHFQLTRNYTSTGCYTFIEDCSSNGTYVNGSKLGKGSKQFLSNNDEIAICHLDNRSFVYMETIDEKENIQMPAEIDRCFTIGKILGTGAYGEVRLAFEKSSCRRVAVKIINKEQLCGAGSSQAKHSQVAGGGKAKGLTPSLQVQREIEILRALDHPCIIGVEAVEESLLAFYLVLELAEGGDLHTRLKNNKGPIGESLTKIFFLQIASAVDYLHQQQVTHRDLKPENILLMTNDREAVCKVTDFGLAKLASTMSSMTTFCGTPLFVAPEVIRAQGGVSYTSAVDLWSLGVLLYLCLVSELPFNDARADLPLSQQILSGSYSFPSPRWALISPSAKALIGMFLQVDPSQRATAGEALNMEWLDDENAKAFVDNLVYSTPRSKSPALEFIPRLETARAPSPAQTTSHQDRRVVNRGRRSATPTVTKDANDNSVKGPAVAAVDRPLEDIVAASNFAATSAVKRRSNILVSSSGSSGNIDDGCGFNRAKQKRMRVDP